MNHSQPKADHVPQMISLEEARSLVLGKVQEMPLEEVGILTLVGRVCAEDLTSDIDVSPFTHSAMDGYALRADQLSGATPEAPVELEVVAEIPAGSWFDGAFADNQCARIMTGAPLPPSADSVAKYEAVKTVKGDGRKGSIVSFADSLKRGSNVRPAGEEAHAGETIVHAGEVIHPAGIGFLASCGVTKAQTYQRPKVAIIATGSELVEACEVPTKGKIRNSNSWALAACVVEAGGDPDILPIAADEFESLCDQVVAATKDHDFVITTGGAANGDYDFIKKVVEDLGDLLMTTVNMRPGKAQTFGLVNGTPVFGLPGNPAAAYLGFEMLIRPALRKMQGYSHYDRPRVVATLAQDVKKNDTRRIFNRALLAKTTTGNYMVSLAGNQSSGLFGPIQHANCFMVLPEGPGEYHAGDEVECILLDIPEEVLI